MHFYSERRGWDPCLHLVITAFLFIFLNGCGGPDNTGQLPTISSITSATGLEEGPVTGGTSVTIQGKNFADDALVSFGDQVASVISVPNFETIVATTPSVFISGPVPVTVTTTGQVTKKPDAFTFTPVIAFFSDRDGDNDIYLMEIDGGGVRPLTINKFRDGTSDFISDERPRFSSDGQSVIFESNRTGDFDIFTIGRNGQEPTNLTLDPALDHSATFSPDDSEVVFVSNRLNFSINAEQDPEIFLMDRDGGNIRQLTQNGGGVDDREPIFSPDGKRIAFSSDRDGDSEIFIMNRDGTGVQQLTNNSASDLEPVFSPEGSQIVFSSNRDGNSNLYAISLNGSNLLQLTTHSENDVEPSFLPRLSERKIVFTSKRTGDDELFVMNCVGTDTRYITSCDETTITNISHHADDDREGASSP